MFIYFLLALVALFLIGGVIEVFSIVQGPSETRKLTRRRKYDQKLHEWNIIRRATGLPPENTLPNALRRRTISGGMKWQEAHDRLQLAEDAEEAAKKYELPNPTVDKVDKAIAAQIEKDNLEEQIRLKKIELILKYEKGEDTPDAYDAMDEDILPGRLYDYTIAWKEKQEERKNKEVLDVCEYDCPGPSHGKHIPSPGRRKKMIEAEAQSIDNEIAALTYGNDDGRHCQTCYSQHEVDGPTFWM